MKQSDTELVRKAVAGDQEAFVVLVKRHQGMVTGITFSILQDVGASEDAAQDAFVKAWKRIGSLRDATKWRPWLGQLARNTAINHLRKITKEKSEPLSDYLPDRSSGPDEMVGAKDETEFVMAALEKLPEKFRTPLVLFYREERSAAAVGEAMGLSEAAVRQRLKRGRDALRGEVEESLGRVLARTMPSVAFTVSVVSALSASAPATVSAAGAATASFSSPVTSGSSVVSTTVAMVKSSKISLAVAALVGVVSIPVGYGVSGLLKRDREGNPGKPLSERVVVENQISRESIVIPPSRVGEEWARLQERFGVEAEAMPLIYEEISLLKDEFLRDALSSLLMAKWVRVDGVGGFDFLRKKKDQTWKVAFVEEWLRFDADVAIAGIQATDKRWSRHLTAAAVELAKQAPDFYLKNFQRLIPRSEESAEIALEILAKYDAVTLREAAVDALAKKKRADYFENALAKAMKQWGENEGATAFQWALDYKGEGAKKAQAGALTGWARVAPRAALDQFAELRFKEERYLSDGGGRDFFFKFLPTVAEAHLEETLLWCQESAEMESLFVRSCLSTIGRVGLAQEPEAFLDRLQSLDLLDDFAEAGMTSYAAQNWRPIYQWLQNQPAGNTRSKLLNGLLEGVAAENAESAVELVDGMPDGEKRSEARQLVASKLVDSASLEDVDYYRKLYPEWSEELVLAAFSRLGMPRYGRRGRQGEPFFPADIEPWLAEAEQLEPEKLPPNLMAALLQSEPERALSWLAEIPSERFEESEKLWLYQRGFSSWVYEREEEALSFLSTVQSQNYYDASALEVSDRLNQRGAPLNEVWPWFASIGDAGKRGEAFRMFGKRKQDFGELTEQVMALDVPENERAQYLTLIRKEAAKP